LRSSERGASGRRAAYGGALLLVALLALLHIPYPFSSDQGLFAHFAQAMDGGARLYEDLWDIKQPGLFALYWIAGRLFGFDSVGIHIFDLQGNLMKKFRVSNGADWRGAPLPGLFMDSEDHLYISDRASDMVLEYDREGQLVGAFGRPGVKEGEFNAPSGMWADSTAHLYIVDAHRIQIFRIERPK
jgi:hypothetical protein